MQTLNLFPSYPSHNNTITHFSPNCRTKPRAAPSGIRCTVRGISTDSSAPSSTMPTTGRSYRPPSSIGTQRRQIFASAHWSGTRLLNCCWIWTTAVAAAATVACPRVSTIRSGTIRPSRIRSSRRKSLPTSLSPDLRRPTCKHRRQNCTRRAPGATAAATVDTVAIVKYHPSRGTKNRPSSSS